MKIGFLARLIFCIFLFSIYLYLYVERQNKVTELRLNIPNVVKDVRELKENISSLQYDIEHFESPSHLLELSKKMEFRHLKYPNTTDILILSSDSHNDNKEGSDEE
jgi:hypothetical protein